jgi:hypothetical protein
MLVVAVDGRGGGEQQVSAAELAAELENDQLPSLLLF